MQLFNQVPPATIKLVVICIEEWWKWIHAADPMQLKLWLNFVSLGHNFFWPKIEQSLHLAWKSVFIFFFFYMYLHKPIKLHKLCPNFHMIS